MADVVHCPVFRILRGPLTPNKVKHNVQWRMDMGVAQVAISKTNARNNSSFNNGTRVDEIYDEIGAHLLGSDEISTT